MEKRGLAWQSWFMNDLFSPIANRQSAIQLIRYALVGVASNLIGYIIYLLITYLGGTPKLTMTLLYIVGATISFVGNSKLTFCHRGSYLGAGMRYAVVYCTGYLINIGILVVMVDILGYAHQYVQGCAILVVAGLLFLALKFFVFRQQTEINT